VAIKSEKPFYQNSRNGCRSQTARLLHPSNNNNPTSTLAWLSQSYCKVYVQGQMRYLLMKKGNGYLSGPNPRAGPREKSEGEKKRKNGRIDRRL